MSNFARSAYHPVEKVVRHANWIDNHFGPHQYGVSFPGDDSVYTPNDVEIPLSTVFGDASETDRLRRVMCDVAHLAATLGSGSQGWLRGRFMSISNALNAAIGRQQSSHGNQYDNAGNITKPDPLADHYT